MRCTNELYAQFIPIDKDLILATKNCISEFNLTLDFEPGEKSICAIVFPKRSKSRVIFEALLHDLRAAKTKGISRHRFREFAYELSRGKFVWHNAPFKCSQRQVYKVMAVLLKLGMLRLEKRPGDRDPRYYVSIMDFSSNLNRVAKKWEKEFAEVT